MLETGRMSPARLMIVACLVFFPILFALNTGYMLYQERLAVGQAAEQQAENIATALQNDLEHAIGTVDAALNDVKVGLPIVEKQPLSLQLQDMILFDGAMRQSAYGAVLVINERGVATYDSRSTIPRQSDFVARRWFKAHRDNAQLGLFVDLISHGLSGMPVMTFSRGLKRPDGSFGGVVVATIQLSLLKDMFGSLHLGQRDDVVLRMTDGRGIYRRSTGSDVFGTDLSQWPSPAQPAKPSNPMSLFDADETGQLVASRQLRSLPLAIVVGLSNHDIYAAWWSGAAMAGGAVGLLLLVASLLAVRLRSELRRRERAEAELRGSETKFRLLADNASDMISRVDFDGERDYVSPAAERLLGIGPEHLLGRALWSYIDPRDRDAVAEFSTTINGSSTPLSSCFRVIRANGEQRWIEALARPIVNPITRAPAGYISAWRDITDRKHAQIRLSESEACYRALADHASDIITSLDLDLYRTYVSPAVRTILGFDPTELVGASPMDIVHPEDRQAAATSLHRLQSGESEREVLTCRLRHRSGHYVWIEGKLALIRDPVAGAPQSILCSIRDISERRAQQEILMAANLGLERLSRHLAQARDTAQQANSAKSRFLANVSHELRTPLNGILGYTQLLKLEGGLDPKQAARVEAMIGAGQHLLEMINGVLDISEIEAGHFELRPAPANLVGISAACLDLVRPAAESKSLSLILTMPEDLPSRIIVDPTRLRQILLNLLSNAVKYTAVGEVELSFRQIGHAKLRAEISDSGPGIPADQRERLFQDFERLGVDTVSEVEGAGIGLALSYRLAAAMGGTMGHEDKPTGGSIFWFELPFELEATAEQAGVVDDSKARDLSSPLCLRVLVVDDIAINRDVTASFLRVAGHESLCAESGEEAVAMAGESRFDIILMDVRMPGIGGLEATRQIRALNGPASLVPIAALTAQAFAEEIAACRAAGMDAHLTKPFTQSALRDVLDQATELNRQRRKTPDAAMPDHAIVQSASDLPLLDQAAFQQIVETLPAGKIPSHLSAMLDRTNALLQTLRTSEVLNHLPNSVEVAASAAHVIAGSAGVFGFALLSTAARSFEYAARYQPNELAQRSASLIAAADASVPEMARCLAEFQFPTRHEIRNMALT